MEADQRLIGPLLDGLLCQWSSSESIRWTMRWITWPPLILPSPRISLTNNQCFFVSVPVKFNLLVLYTNFLLSAENCYLNIDSTTYYALLLVILSSISILLQVWPSSHHGMGFNIQESLRDFGGQYSNWSFDTTPGFVEDCSTQDCPMSLSTIRQMIPKHTKSTSEVSVPSRYHTTQWRLLVLIPG